MSRLEVSMKPTFQSCLVPRNKMRHDETMVVFILLSMTTIMPCCSGLRRTTNTFSSFRHLNQLRGEMWCAAVSVLCTPYLFLLPFWLRKFIGRVLPGQSTSWSSRCWKEVSASVEKLKDTWKLHVKVAKAQHLSLGFVTPTISNHQRNQLSNDLSSFEILSSRICNEVFGLFTASHFRIGSFSTPIGGQKTFTFEMGRLESL